MKILWSNQAVEDLRDICAYIHAHSPTGARKTRQVIRTATRRLGRFPLSGRVVPEFPESGYREVLALDYRVLYRVLDQYVLIVTVVHGRRDLGALPPFGR